MTKFIKSACLLLAANVSANFETIKNDVYAGIDAAPGNGTRTITQDDMDLINEYGCWCYFQDDHSKGHSAPVDGIDQLCKVLHDGYQCAIMDAADLGHPNCVPWDVVYNSAVGSGLSIGMTIDTIRTECDSQNPTVGCANWACKVEGYFIQQLVLYFVSGGSINHDLRHENGFEPAVSCPVLIGTDSPRECCDQQPVRFPYKTYDGARECCVSHTFDTTMYQCCDDNVIRVTCD